MKRILIIAGEASGDHHAAKLVTAVRQQNPQVEFFGMGGPAMAAAGVDILIDNRNMAVVGAIEIFSHIIPIVKAWRKLSAILHHQSPDLLILVDYPGFNLQMARIAHRAGVKVLYYISPQLWAWKKRRVKLIQRWVNKMLVVFPFEEEFYRQHGVAAEFVGHPLAGTMQPSITPAEARLRWQIADKQRVIGLLPGSRAGEIRRLLPTLLASAEQLFKRHPDLLFVLPVASSLSLEELSPYLTATKLPLRVIPNEFYNVMQLCDAAIVTSGTATLEVALMGIPLVVVYKTAATTYYIGKRLIKIPFIGLCNIVAGKRVAQELIQHQANPQMISAEVDRLLEDKAYQDEMRLNLAAVKNNLGKTGGSAQAARAVCTLLEE